MSIQRLLRQIRNSFLSLGKTLTRWLSNFVYQRLGKLLGIKQRPQSGFVLPTVTMVMLVVSLLTLAMLLRSTDRAKNAHNFRVNEATLNATAPALDRARAKIDKLFSDPTLSGRGTPSDGALLEVFSEENIKSAYTFGDETPLVLVSDADEDDTVGKDDTEDKDVKDGNISRARPEFLTSAWKFPVDTDNDGLFDTFTLYGIYLANSPGEEERPRYPLEARTSPMSEGQKPSRCKTTVVTSASKVGTSGWLKIDSKLKKSIYVYAANIPITSLNDSSNNTVLDDTIYETFQGAGGFSAIEYQQDRSRIPLSNNAVVYEDDLQILPGAGLELNGRIFTNGSLLIGETSDDVRLWLVSSPDSCFYEEEISKVLVGGNLANGRVNDTKDRDNARIDLFQGQGAEPKTKKNLGKNEKSITAKGGEDVTSNTFAYQERVDYLVDAAFKAGDGDYGDNGETGEGFAITKQPDFAPQGLINSIESRMRANADLDFDTVLREELEVYFRQRTRRVPYAEVPAGEPAVFIDNKEYKADDINTKTKAENFFKNDRSSPSDVDKTGLAPLRPPNSWMYPIDPDDNTKTYMNARTGGGKLELDVDNPKASDPALRDGKEHLVGDRVLIGNNLPEYVYNLSTQEFTQNGEQDLQKADNKWFEIDGSTTTDNIRTRTSQVTTLTQLGATDRDGFWELKAAEAPEDPVIDTVGGLRVVTGAGLYLQKETETIPSFPGTTPSPEEWPLDYTAWPDWMPIPKGHQNIYDELGKDISNNQSEHPYLVMRATAVYHHDNNPSDKGDPYDPNETKVPERYQQPIACVSGYYDPTDEASDTANSNNGIVYKWPGDQWRPYLTYQAKLRFPNGNWVNPILHELDDSGKINLGSGSVKSGETLTLSERTAIDTAFCAYSIWKNPGSNKDTSLIPDDTIYETALLDAREIKAIEKTETLGVTTDTTSIYEPSNYDLAIEERQPLEIRATVLDLDKMRQEKFGADKPTQEYLLPNSGIIYATREDAVRDNTVPGKTGQSAKDSVLDPYRRPNAIMLVNGADLSREEDYRLEERGLILVTNSSVYIKGDFNKHEKGEFTTGTHLDYTRTKDKLDPNFACRKDQFTECSDGESWRPATVIADAVMLLSDNFQEGYRTDGDYDLRWNFDDPAHWWNNAGTYEFSLVKPSADVASVVGIDLNNDGDATDTSVKEEDIRLDIDGDGTVDTTVGLDLNLDSTIDATTFNETTQSSATIARAIRRLNGFFDNNFVTSRAFTDADYSEDFKESTYKNNFDDRTKSFQSSYFNNFITPIQRRVEFPEYVMEICTKFPISACGPDDWRIIYDLDATSDISDISEESQPQKLDLNLDGALGSLSVTGGTTVDESSLINIDANKTATDNLIDPTIDEDTLLMDLNRDGSISASVSEADTNIKASDLPFFSPTAIKSKLLSGTTAVAAADGYTHYPRRVAFLRDLDNELILQSNTPVALGIDSSGNVMYSSYNPAAIDANKIGSYNSLILQLESGGITTTALTPTSDLPNGATNALWFRTTESDSDPTTQPYYGADKRLGYVNQGGVKGNIPGEQPLLVPILQLQVTENTPSGTNNFSNKSIAGNPGKVGSDGNKNAYQLNWMQHATGEGTFNLVMTTGDVPGRPQDTNGGLGNYPRFLESWRKDNNKDNYQTTMLGSFIQLSRSSYADASFWKLIEKTTYGGIYKQDDGLFDYWQNYQTSNGTGRSPYYSPPSRNWGFDVALLTQQPDLFSQQFTTPPTADPNEFFRQVNRDDEWVKTLLCAAQETDGFDSATSAYGKNYTYAIPADQQPGTCPFSP